MARQYVGIVTEGTTSSIVPIDPANITTASFYQGILHTNLTDYNFASDKITQPYIVGTATSTRATVSSIATLTPSYQAGDLLLLFASNSGGAGGRTYTGPVGWTTEKTTALAGESYAAVWSKTATASESASYTVTVVGGTSNVGTVMLSIRGWSSDAFSDFSTSSNTPTITVPDDSSSKKLLIFYIASGSVSQTWDVTGISEFQTASVTTNASLDVSSIYRTSSNTSLTYSTTQTSGASSGKALAIVIT